jgi:hypothetical protein
LIVARCHSFFALLSTWAMYLMGVWLLAAGFGHQYWTCARGGSRFDKSMYVMRSRLVLCCSSLLSGMIGVTVLSTRAA